MVKKQPPDFSGGCFLDSIIHGQKSFVPRGRIQSSVNALDNRGLLIPGLVGIIVVILEAISGGCENDEKCDCHSENRINCNFHFPFILLQFGVHLFGHFFIHRAIVVRCDCCHGFLLFVLGYILLYIIFYQNFL